VAEVHGLHEVGPLRRRRQLVGGEVARVPHQAVAGERLAEIEAVGVVDRVVAHLRRRRLVDEVGHRLEQLLSREHLEGIGRRGPEDVGPLAGRQLANVGDALDRVLVQDLELDGRVRLLERRLVGLRQLLRKRGDDGDGAGLHEGGGERERRGDEVGGNGPEAAGHADLL
jgi:hypothetical protein